ncbi:GntR family transcriptional regulator [Labrenzia sp. CE80]|uniref:GntR family transcriptional regulator n=1 Tax=Labrenzia sp. CE80 TaxID=1788986 RepID=UPI00129A9B77|nr:GntR family transcriptional regulator [Labrenzia sp. CE80]
MIPAIEQTESLYQLSDITKMSGSLAQRVYAVLREAILTLHLPPGALLKKQAICEQLGVSRSPVTEAITRLAAEGLVEVIPQSGSRVTKFSMPEIREGAFLREAIELAAVAKVAAERSADQLSQLKRNMRLQAMCLEEDDELGFYREDERFHELILEFTGYPKLGTLADTGWIQVNRARQLLLPLPERAKSAFKEHQEIMAAITAANPEAARGAMKKHLSELVTRLEPLARDRPDLFD